MADWQLIEEGLKRGYSLDEVTDILAKEEGVDPSYARERGFDSPTILGRLGYAKPEATKPEKGFIGNVLDQAAHGVKTAYQGLLSAPGIYAGNPDAERIAGTIQAEQSHEKPKEMREAEAAFADVSKRQSDFESVYGKDSGYMDSIGKIMDMLVTTGKEIVTNPKGMAYEMASQSGNMVAPMVGAYAGGKTGAVTGALLGPKGAVAGGVVGAGAGGFAGSHVMEQSGEFRGKVAERLTELGLEPTAENVSAIFQDKAWLDKTLEETRDKATGTAVTDGVLAAIGGLAVNAPIRAAQKTARAQLGATATAKQVSDAASDILASQPKWQKVAPHLKAGAIGWGGEPISEAAGQQYGYGHIDYGDVGMEAFAAAGEGIGSVYAAAKGMRTNPTPPANVTPSPSITSAPTTDGAIKAFQDEVASVTPRGSFGSMDDLAGLIESERSDLGKRRGLLAQQQQDARDMENEFNGLVKDEQIDQSYRLNDAQQQRDAERARDGGYDLALQQREEQQGRTVEQQVAASEAQGFGEQEPTAMQLAMQLAKQKALDSEFDGLLKQERTSINELRANVKKVAGVPVESISTPQLEEIAQSEAHPNTKMAAVAALNDRHDAIQQERERLMQLRETRLERQSNQPEQGAQHGAESHEADGQVATPSVAGGGIDVPGGGFDAAMVASVGGVRGTAGAGAAVSRSGQVGAVPVADQPANVRALTENAAKRQATQLTNQGYPTAAYPHPTQAGMWAIGSQDEAKAATVPAPSATQNDVPPRQSASWVIRNKETGEVVMETFDRKKVDALNTAKYEAVPIREYLEGLNKRNESTAAEPPAVEVRSPVKRKLPASNNIAQAIINMGGVSTSLKNDILGDASIKTRPGLFTTNGTGDLGEIAAMLSSGFGFSQIDLNDPTDNSGAKQLADLIARSVNGETIHNEEAMIRAQEQEQYEQARAEINQQAADLNIKPIRGKRTLEIVQAEINAILAEREEMTRRSREVQPLFDEVAEQELIDEFNLKVQEYHDENAIARADRAEESARLSAEESAQGDGDSVDQAAPSESRTSPTEGGRGEAEVTPEFGLVGQTEAEAISEQERLNQPEGLTKEQIDREAAAPFSLDGGTLAPEGAGVQGSMLTPDGRVSKDAEAKPAENKPTREFIGTGDKLYSESGRALAPAPKIETGTDRKINASTKRMNAWLLDEARKEAEANGNDWQQTLLRGIDANKMQKPDQDTVNDILFGDPDGPQAKHRAPHEGTVETPREAQSILKPLNPDAEAIAKADADFEDALSDLGDIIGQNFRMNFTPEQEQKIIPVLTRLFDAAFRKGYYTFKDAARFVLDIIKAKFGVDIEEQITLQHMQGAYIGMSGRYRDQGADSARVVVAVENKKELEVVNGNDQHRGSNLERDSQDANVADGMGEEGVRNERGGNRDGRGSGIQDSQGEGGPRGGVSVSGREAVSSRERGDLEIYTGAPELSPGAAGNRVDLGSRDSGLAGPPVEPDATKAIGEAATKQSELVANKAEQARADKTVPHKGGIAAIRDALPILTEGQQEDVAKAETRFAVPDGYGMLFTNGTGTGKTFTGLGVIKRLANQGKTNILVVAPNDKIIEDWQKAGKLLGLDISRLADTNDSGEGIVITTHSNMGQNNALASREWDLVVSDEAHYLAMGKDGANTNALKTLRAITLHPDGVHHRYAMLYAGDIERLKQLDESAKSDRMSDFDVRWQQAEVTQKEADKLRNELKAKQDAIKADVADRQGEKRPRALFLSATPFAYEKTVDWANGYLFDYNEGRSDEEREFRGYNAGSNLDQFMMQHFGYRMRYGKLTQPDAKVDSGLMQRQFNTWLKKKGSLSGRMLDVAADYDRRFILVDSAIGQRIDDALEWFESKRKAQRTSAMEAGDRIGRADPYENALSAVRDQIGEKFDYLSRRYLLESIKAREVVPHVREHLAMGRKVVVFHDYKKGGGFNPFLLDERSVKDQEAIDATIQAAEWNRVVREFNAEFKDIIHSDLFRQSSPIDMFKAEFPGVLLFNGDVPAKTRRDNVAKFQDDASGPQVILVQSAAGKEGISLHDTTGKHQRVLFNLGQPTQPTTAIQQEGRIYRTGQKSDAIFRYLNTGTNWEKWAFATTIAQRASAAENLGMGEQARALKDAFIAGFEESDDYRAGMENEGKGGKERDKAANSALTEYDRAKAFYFGTQKKNSKTKAQEGTDYFATPEPVGLKMMELADIRPGESVLEPSAGHGAIARWAPDTVEKTAIEPSMTLRPRLAMVFDGKILGQTFEELHVSNKYDAIVMNPPFGSGGRTAVDHVALAATHLRDGGRIVALIPRGPAADAKFEKWLYEDNEKPIKPLYIDPNHGPVYKGDTLTLSGFGSLIDIVVAHVDGEEGRARYVRPAGYKDSGAVNITAITKVKPTGKRTESFSPSKGINLVANIDLPQVTFERAGTKVATRIVVLEKSENAPQQTNRDYSNATDIGDLFDRMENLSIAPRAKAAEPIAEAPAPARASKPVVDTEAAKAGADALGLPIIEHTTGRGKVIKGVVRTDLSKEAAKAIDEFTFKKDGGWFIREKHLAALSDGVAMFSRGRGKLRSRPRGEITHETQRLEKEINRDLARQGQATIGAAGFITRSAVPDNAHRIVKAVEKLFGVRVEFVQVEDERANIFNGVFLGGNTLFVNVDSSSPISTVIGHEFLHFLKESSPDIYAKAEKDLLALANARKFAAAAIKHQPAMNAGEEVIADTFGDQFSNPEFWEELANRLAPSLFMRVRAAFTRFLGKLLGEIKAMGATHKTDTLYSDLTAVRDAVLSATVGAANGRKLATPEWRNLHARFMTAWHGSPHDHDGFSMAHIGTGEGAQAYGYGLYFAGAREVAEGYRVALTSSAAKKQFDVAAALAAAKWFKSGMVVNGTTYYSRMDLQDDIAKQNLSSMHMPDEVRQVFADKLSERNGRLYQVELAPEQDEYLDSDKPLSEQSEKVKAALQAVEKQRLVGIIEKRKQRRAQLAEEGGDTAALDRQIEVLQEELDADALDLGGDGNNYYKSLSMKLGSDKAASKYLHSLGIRGIRYLDGSSRSAGEGNHNFVIFDDKDVKITAKESRSALSREAFAHNALQELATEDALFRYPVSKSASVDGVMREVFPGVEYYGEHTLPDERTETGADHRYVFRTPDTPAKDGRPEQKGKQFEVFTTDAGRVWVDVYRLQPGDQGSRVYAAVANYAHNARKVFGGDPVGVSPAAIIARTKMMLASALRFGTTRHLNAAREQEKGMPDDGIPPLEWRGNDIDKTRALIQNYLATVHSKAPAIRNYSYDFDTKRFVTNATGLEFHPSGPAFDAALGEDQRRAAGVGADSGRAAILIQSLVSKESGGIGDGGILQAILDDSRSLIEDGGLKGLFSMTTPANAGVSVSAPSESVRRIQAVVERFKQLFKGTSALDIRVVSTTFDIPARFRPSPFAEGVFHDDAGLVYLVTMNLRNQRGDVNEGRAWQVLLHEAVGHYGLSQMMGEKFAGILKAVKQATSTKGRVTDETRDTFQPGDKDYATWDAVKLRYPDASDSELAQEVLARMSETDPGSSVLGYAVATVRQWVRDVARAMGVNVMVSTSELRDLVAKASGYMRRGDNVVNTFGPLYSMSTGLESRAATVQPQGPIWSAPEMSRTDNIIYTMQDKNIDLKRVQQAIKETVGEIRDDIDAYLQEELFHGRAAKITEEFLDKEVNPLISLMRASNVSMEEMETFLWARHAKERNAQIAKINDEMPDGGSGLTNKQADDLMGGKDVTIGDKTIAGVKPARKKLLSDLAGRVDAITKGNRALLERYGLESAETLNAWDGAYQHYVPLHREDTDSHLAGMGTGQGYSVKGSSSKRATGSSRPVENILANLALQRERIITRGEKNRVAQAIHGLAKEMPNADLWEVDVKPTMRTTAMIGGREQVVDAVDPNFRNKPNVVFARFNGEDRFVVFNEHNERAVRMAEALKNLDADDISHLLGEVSRWTRYFASINTQYNPIFGVTNLVRDVQTGLLNLKSTPLDGKQMEMAGGLVHALPAVFKALRADRKGQSATGTWAQLWEEFQEVGGQTGYRDMFRNSHERAEALQNALDPAWWQKTWWGKAATVGGILAAPEQVFVEKVGKPFMELLSDYNTMMENGIRLSAYKLALDSGMTKERAASLAKNLTVNFNRKGQAGRQVGAMYAFFNASVQGTARMAETLNHGAKPGELLGKAGKQIVYGGLMLGALQAMLLLAAGFDDEEPPEFVRDRNIIIPTGNGKYISIPLPLGFHVLPTIGRISIEFTAGGFKKPGEHLVHIMDVLLDSFNPIGNAGLSMQTLAPTVLDPVAALTENKDWSGRQIARQDFSKLNPTPGYTRAKDTASSLSRGLAYALNYLSGGGEYGIGIVSPTPDQIEYLIGQVTGGVGRELGKVATTGEAIGTGEDLPPHKIPLVGRFYGDTMGQSSEASKFYGTLEKLAEHKGALDRMKDAHASEAYQDYLRKHPESRLYGRAASVQREVANLRKLKRQLLDRGADRAKIRQVEDRMKAVMARFNQSASEHIRNQQ